MNGHTVTTLRTTYQVQNEINEMAAEAVRRAYDHGFRVGEQVGSGRALRGLFRAVDGALGIGFVIGVAVGATVCALIVGWPV